MFMMTQDIKLGWKFNGVSSDYTQLWRFQKNSLYIKSVHSRKPRKLDYIGVVLWREAMIADAEFYDGDGAASKAYQGGFRITAYL